MYYDPRFCGTDTYWKNIYGLVYVDSVKYFCESHEAYWTLDVISSYLPIFRKYPFLILTFDVEDSKCTFNAKEDTDRNPIIEQIIEYTDLTVSVKLYFTNDVVIFPSDY